MASAVNGVYPFATLVIRSLPQATLSASRDRVLTGPCALVCFAGVR